MPGMRLNGSLVAAAPGENLRYLLLPYGENQVGLTNLGKVIASKGVLTLPSDPSHFVLNKEHDRKSPVGVGVSFDDTDEGLYAEIRPLDTTAGRDLFVEAHEGVRDGISVEIASPVTRNGRLLSGVLEQAGAVTEPAWENARLLASAMEDAPDEGGTPGEGETQELPPVEEEDQTDPHVDEEETPMPENETPVAGATPEPVVPALVASRATPPPAPPQLTLREATGLMLAAKNGDTSAMVRLAPAAQLLLGALDNFTATEGAASTVPQWVDEVWSGQPYTRRIIPLLSPATLTSMKIQGWRWKIPPEVEVYAGLPAEINSNQTEIETVEEDATRWAGGARIDRRFTDFNDSTVVASFLSKLAESYAKKTDIACGDFLLANSTTVTLGTVPAGVSEGLAAIVDCALSFIDFATPSYALVAKNLYRDLILMRSEDAMAFLSASLGLDEGTMAGFKVVPVASYAAGTVVVAAREAATHYELPGSPIRVNAQAIAVGAVDEAVFGYDDTLVNDLRAVASAIVT